MAATLSPFDPAVIDDPYPTCADLPGASRVLRRRRRPVDREPLRGRAHRRARPGHVLVAARMGDLLAGGPGLRTRRPPSFLLDPGRPARRYRHRPLPFAAWSARPSRPARSPRSSPHPGPGRRDGRRARRRGRRRRSRRPARLSAAGHRDRRAARHPRPAPRRPQALVRRPRRRPVGHVGRTTGPGQRHRDVHLLQRDRRRPRPGPGRRPHQLVGDPRSRRRRRLGSDEDRHVLRAVAYRGQRDHDEPDRQRHAGPVRARRPGPRPHPIRRGGGAASYDAPLQALFRATTREIAVAGTTIPKDARVMVLFGYPPLPGGTTGPPRGVRRRRDDAPPPPSPGVDRPRGTGRQLLVARFSRLPARAVPR